MSLQIYRLFAVDTNPVPGFMVMNLAASDFLMGVYLVIIAGVGKKLH